MSLHLAEKTTSRQTKCANGGEIEIERKRKRVTTRLGRKKGDHKRMNSLNNDILYAGANVISKATPYNITN